MSLFHKSVFTVALGLVAAIFAAACSAKHFIETARLEEAFGRHHSAVAKSAARMLRPEDFRTPTAAPAQRQLRAFAQELSAPEVARIAVWSRDQRVLFSDHQPLIGKRFPERSDLARVLKEGQPSFERREHDTQMFAQAGPSDFLDVYVPIRAGAGTAISGAVEIFLDSQAILAPVQRQIRYTVLALALSGLLAFGLAFFLRSIIRRAHQERARREKVEKLVGELAGDAMQLDFGALTKKLQDKARDLLNVDIVEIEVWDKEQLKALTGADAEGMPIGKKTAQDSEWIFKNRQPLLIQDIGTTADTAAPVQLGRRGVKGYLGVPLISRNNKTVGVLRLLSRSTGNLSGELELLQQLASGVALALENLRLQEQNREQGLKLDIAGQKLTDHATEITRSTYEIEQLAHALSRDLQEPLRVVASSINHLAKNYAPKLDATAQECIHHTLDGAKRMHTMISDVLGYARVAANHGRTFAPVDSAAVLRKILERLRTAMSEKGAVVTHDKLPVIEADEAQLGQLLENLLRNAIKYCASGVPRVHVSCGKDYGFWCFKVKDNGVGIEPEFTERIFAIFERLHTTEAYPGTGMGLSVCKKIVEGHGGKIWVESQPGAGSTFCFTVPFKPAASPPRTSAKSSSPGLRAER
ncbi:MAG: GAF domain-containing protein [Deltaproteobacteria bacterium]|nr:GAF domain-containing protein [Deltaproteobacteria bacterium]